MNPVVTHARIWLFLLTACWAFAAPLETRVSGLAVDVVYLSAGSAQGLAPGLKGELRTEDGRRAEVEVLFVSTAKASCRVAPAGAEVRVGDAVWFEVAETPAEPGPQEAPEELPPAAQAALERAASENSLGVRGWWRADASRWEAGDDPVSGSRLALGLRASLSRHKDLVLSTQMRHRGDNGGGLGAESRLDELALSGKASRGRVAWQAGRLADGRGALPGPVDGVALESAGAGPWRWGLSAGSRPMESSGADGRGSGAGGRLRWQPGEGPLASDLKLRWERDGNDLDRGGASWSLQARLPRGLRLEHWQRGEFIRDRGWSLASRLASSRLRWSTPVWQAELGHQLSRVPTQIPEDELPAGPAVDRERRHHTVEASLARSAGEWWAQLRASGRGDALDGDLERRLELGAARSRKGRLWRRAGGSLGLFLGPAMTGQDLALRTTLAPRRGPEWELEGRTWRLEPANDVVAGWNGGLHARGRLPGRLRWEVGGLFQSEEGESWREVRVGLRGDLDLSFQLQGGKP